MQRFFPLFVAFYFFALTSLQAADLSDNADLVEAAFKYYEAVDKAKTAYETELRKALEDAKKRGNLSLYNALEKELEHTAGANGHSVTKFSPPDRTLFSKKASLQKAVGAARIAFKKAAKEAAADVLKAGNVALAREIDRLAAAVEPPRSLAVRTNDVEAARTLLQNAPIAKLKIELKSPQSRWYYYGRFTPDCKKFVVVGRSERCINVFDLETGEIVSKLQYPDTFFRTDIHPDNKTAVSGADNGKIVLWNILDGSIIREITAYQDKPCVMDTRFSSDGSFFASGSSNQIAAIWETATGKERMQFKGHTATVWTVDISPDDKTLATAAQDGNVRLWDIATGRELHRMTGHTNTMARGLAFNHKGTVLASGSADGTVIFWDVKTGRPTKRMTGFDSGVDSIGFSPDGSQLAVGCRDGGRSGVWDVETMLPLYRIPSGGGWTLTAQFSPDGKMVATRSDRAILIWESYKNDSVK